MGIMRVARIARTGSLYDASVVAQTFGDVDRSLENPIDFEGAIDANFTNATGHIKSGHIPVSAEFLENMTKDVDGVNLLKENRQ